MSDNTTSGHTLDDYEQQQRAATREIEVVPFNVWLRVSTTAPSCGCGSQMPAHKKRGKDGAWRCDQCFR